MLEHAIYSVISPEGAASILWRDTAKAQEAATSMKITAPDMVRFGVIDTIVEEPTGGAHRDPQAAIALAGDAIASAFFGAAGPRSRRPSASTAARSSSQWDGMPVNEVGNLLLRTMGLAVGEDSGEHALRMPHLMGNHWVLRDPPLRGVPV